ncbi:homocysteine S-methyltransferase [Elongatibacter sediminis]|uniref:S-methylmethionine:homocysteine methyltransferase n=1 Tax=Elongatibacter sediminis TaxID=3119006 RepID=A0AAW9RL42_9GAMM
MRKQRQPRSSQGHTRNCLNDLIDTQGFAIIDGALATELERHGADLDDPLWSARCLMEAPELITRVHRDYLEAGADIILSATYQASEAGFRSRGLKPGEARDLMRLGVRLARDERDRHLRRTTRLNARPRPLVAASLGPYGACQHDGSEYHGRYPASWREVQAFHAARLDVLADSGADLLAFETIPSRPEAEGIADLLAAQDGPPAWVSFSCRNDVEVSHGEPLAECLAALDHHPRIVAAGINCTAPRHLGPLLQSVAGSELTLIVYPNSGETWVSGENRWRGEGNADFDVEGWYRAGARAIGGCCRTGPDQIRQIRAALTRAAELSGPPGRHG